jgi:ankyrin repeat protein
MYGHTHIAELLIEHGANLNSRCQKILSFDEGLTPLMISISMGHRDITRILIDHGADLNIGNNYDDDDFGAQNTAISCAVQRNDLETVELLLSGGADVQAPNSRILCDAIEIGHAELVERLIVCGADVNARHVLSRAVEKRLISVVECLVNYGADVKELYLKNWRGATILEEAGIEFQRHVELYIANIWDTTSLHRACFENNIELLEGSLRKSSQKLSKMINARNQLGWTPLHVAAFFNRTVAARLLIDSGADSFATTPCGHTPLHLVCQSTLLGSNSHEMIFILTCPRVAVADATADIPMSDSKRRK